jgi:ABC-type oligopeptide transport system ATPase subunit
MRPHRRDLQAVFQDPYASLNPRMRAADIVAEPIRNFEKLRTRNSATRGVAFRESRLAPGPDASLSLRILGWTAPAARDRARAAPRPKLIVCDEPVSALDVSVQAQVINLLVDLQREFGLSYLFVAHDLAVVEHISHRVAVMYLGRIVEVASKQSAVQAPQHPYTEALLSAVPVPNPTVQRKRIISRGRRAKSDRPADGVPLSIRGVLTRSIAAARRSRSFPKCCPGISPRATCANPSVCDELGA